MQEFSSYDVFRLIKGKKISKNDLIFANNNFYPLYLIREYLRVDRDLLVTFKTNELGVLHGQYDSKKVSGHVNFNPLDVTILANKQVVFVEKKNEWDGEKQTWAIVNKNKTAKSIYKIS